MLKTPVIFLSLSLSLLLCGCSSTTTGMALFATLSEENTEEVQETPDLSQEISGLQDLEVETGSEPDWLANISYDKFTFARAGFDDSDVDLDTPGTYTLTYFFDPRDESQDQLSFKVKVHVVEPEDEDDEEDD